MVKTVKIDGSKLRKELAKRGVGMQEASREIGYSANYISYVCKSESVRESIANALEKKYNITLESYIAKPEEEESEKPQVIDYNELYKCIYTAVYEAVKKAWSE